MYNGLLHAHSGIRYIALALMLIAILQGLIGWLTNKQFGKVHKRIINLNMGVFVAQLVIGITLYIISSKVLFDPAMFKSTLLRFYTLEHPLMMLIASIIVIHYSCKAKANSSYHTHKKLFISHTIALIIIVASIPWPFREQLGAGWF
ncbi:hypothetical protein KDU71_13600 [Carboxylicivirga sediminis]|uniref:Cytochrome B n=1 Tax=Carboxylicivirga sediminis TaxID=2006564 RepID=A0A941F550_9BACT|nr:hypothetical protein [Carboxylicivirga sediminis]MBR8536604.1 hypothetical protein [Carboxylicivirga sediminis]